jgi:uncharacterized protein (DUF2147 family)
MRNGAAVMLVLASVLAGAATVHARTAAVGAVAASDVSSPVGIWKTVDDKTGQARSLVRIYEKDGKLFARIEQSLVPGDEVRTCTKCPDGRKDQPLIGLEFMRGMTLMDGEYRGGDILDPDSGSIYRCKFRLVDGGTKLKVRGFLGVSLFGRSQTWERER